MALARAHECDACSGQAAGYTQAELEKQGWKWNPHGPISNPSFFIVCDECNGAAEQRQRDKRAREARARIPRTRCSHCSAATIVLPAVNVVVGTEFNLALPTSLCPNCDKYPELLRPVVYEPDAFDDPPAFVRPAA